jgi:DNA invertase Pin-like site-specific DNA recombinase
VALRGIVAVGQGGAAELHLAGVRHCWRATGWNRGKRVPRERLDARTIQTLLASGLGPTRIARSLGCSRSLVRRLSGSADALTVLHIRRCWP